MVLEFLGSNAGSRTTDAVHVGGDRTEMVVGWKWWSEDGNGGRTEMVVGGGMRMVVVG
jgi:hypothetical protein